MIHFRKKTSILIAAVLIFALFAGIWALPNLTGKGGRRFEEFLSQTFVDELCSDSLNLHYTLSSPASAGITSYKVSFGDFSKKARTDSILRTRSLLSQLKRYSYRSLSAENRLVYDVLSDYLTRQLALSDYALYDEVLTASGGVSSQLPILLAEYRFGAEQDVEDYLSLLEQTDVYFAQILDFEREKADAGLFMSDRCCAKVIESCEVFTQNPDGNFLITTFDDRLAGLSQLSGAKAQEYRDRNRRAIAEHVIPAYQSLADGLFALIGKGRNDWGLCHYDKGRDYYAVLAAYNSGCDDNVEELAAQIEAARTEDLAVCGALMKDDPGLITRSEASEFALTDEHEMVEQLQTAMLADFPACAKSTWEICRVDEALSDYLAPAFYITAPIDNYRSNRIYINNAADYDKLHLFATLAHEGFPGHLYQTVQSYSYGMNPLHTLLNYPAYTEGWATYVEMQSYYYAGLDESLASLLQHEQAAMLSLYASSDIGIHYYGWKKQEMLDFWSSYGITDENTVEAITELVLNDPGNYLKYYVGYLKFRQLRAACEEKEKEAFDPVKFHEKILRIGPAPFSLLEDKLIG